MKQYFMYNGKKTKLQTGDVLYWDRNDKTLTLWREKQLLLFFDVNNKSTSNRIEIMTQDLNIFAVKNIAKLLAISVGLKTNTCSTDTFEQATGINQKESIAIEFV